MGKLNTVEPLGVMGSPGDAVQANHMSDVNTCNSV